MDQYLDMIDRVLDVGEEKDNRTGTKTRSIFGYSMRFDLEDGFPLMTTKKLHFKSIVHELLWLLSGNTNIQYLRDNGITIWDEWADENGDLGNVYGRQWRAWAAPDGRVVDQLGSVIKQIRAEPESRRLLVSAWNAGELESMALPPCHYSFQFGVSGNRLSCLFNMRSVDVFLGLPFNIASYALLTAMVADQCGLVPHELIWSGADVHLYNNHVQQARIQLARTPYGSIHKNAGPVLVAGVEVSGIIEVAT